MNTTNVDCSGSVYPYSTKTAYDDHMSPRKEKPMKPIECPCCGVPMTFQGEHQLGVLGFETRPHRQEFSCNQMDCKMDGVIIWGDDEKAARKAWNKSLIGQLRKLCKDFKDVEQIPGSIGDICKRMHVRRRPMTAQELIKFIYDKVKNTPEFEMGIDPESEGGRLDNCLNEVMNLCENWLMENKESEATP